MDETLPEPLLQFFQESDEAPTAVQELEALFRDLALQIVALLPPNEERSIALRRLLESLDAALRARYRRG